MRSSLALALAAGLAACSSDETSGGVPLRFPRASLLVISIDTLRADRLGCYGYGRDTSPHLDALAEQSVLFEQLYANSPKTASSHMSLFTSMLPSVHKVRNQSGRLGLVSPSLADNRLTLAQVLTRAGYWTACSAGGGNLAAELGFKKGFQNRFVSVLEDVAQTCKRVLGACADMAGSGGPGFVFMHTYQVHGPYLPPTEYLERFAPDPDPTLGPRVMAFKDMPFTTQWRAMNKGVGGVAFWDGKEHFGQSEARYLSDLYDGEVAYTDEQLGRLLDVLRKRGALDDMIVVVLSDHGEEFGEHGDFEHDQLFREHLHVPCIVRLPGGRLGGTRVTGQASLIDVMPTLLELLDIEGPQGMQGRSLVPAMLTGRCADEPIVAERVMFPDDYKATLRTPSSAVTFHARTSTLTAYDLLADPGEVQDVWHPGSPAEATAARLRVLLGHAFLTRDTLDAVDSGGTVRLDDAERLEELKGLGYVEGAEVSPQDLESTPLSRWPAGDP